MYLCGDQDFIFSILIEYIVAYIVAHVNCVYPLYISLHMGLRIPLACIIANITAKIPCMCQLRISITNIHSMRTAYIIALRIPISCQPHISLSVSIAYINYEYLFHGNCVYNCIAYTHFMSTAYIIECINCVYQLRI